MLGDVTDTKIEVKAALEGEEASVEVKIICDGTILVNSAQESDLGADFVKVAHHDGVRIWETTKPVRLTALLSVGHNHRPTGGEVTSIRTLENDPGHAAWRARKQAGAISSPAFKGVMEGMKKAFTFEAQHRGINNPAFKGFLEMQAQAIRMTEGMKKPSKRSTDASGPAVGPWKPLLTTG